MTNKSISFKVYAITLFILGLLIAVTFHYSTMNARNEFCEEIGGVMLIDKTCLYEELLPCNDCGLYCLDENSRIRIINPLNTS